MPQVCDSEMKGMIWNGKPMCFIHKVCDKKEDEECDDRMMVEE